MQSQAQIARTPITVVSHLVSIFRQYFGSPERLTMEMSKYLWKEDQAESDIYIGHQHDQDTSVVGKRPSIIVGYPDINQSRPVLGAASFENMGQENFLVINDCAFNIACVASSGISSVELATEVKYFLTTFRRNIQNEFCLDKIDVTTFTKPHKVDEYKEYWTSVVVAQVAYQESWGVITESLRIKEVKFGFNLN